MEIIPTAGALGAEILGVYASKPLAPAEIVASEGAILQQLLLVFREQSLTEEEQVRFSRYFGDPEPHVRNQSDRQVPEL